MKTIACRNDLGYTRIAGFTVYDTQTMEFEEITAGRAENMVRLGVINGLTMSSDGEVVPDSEGWNLGNYKIKSGMGNFRDYNSMNPKGEKVYSVVRAISIDGKYRFYEVINNRCARIVYTPEQIRELMQFAWVGGVRLDEQGDIALCKGVVTEDLSDSGIYDICLSRINKTV